MEAMNKAKELDVPLSFHEEDPNLIGVAGVNDGNVSKQLGFIGASNSAEDVLVARDCMLALKTGAKVDIQHISSGNSVDMIRFIKSLGANAYAEATPHHFSLTEEAVLEHGTLAKMNPPLRTEEDKHKIINGAKMDYNYEEVLFLDSDLNELAIYKKCDGELRMYVLLYDGD